MAKVSASNIAERNPLKSGKAPAKLNAISMATAAITGGAFAAVIIKDVETRAEAEAKASTSLKDQLRTLEAMDPKAHTEFRAAVQVRVDAIATSAGLMKPPMTVTDYRKVNSVADSVYVQLSAWKSLSLACAAGFKPDYSMAWSAIKQEATSYKNSSGASSPELKQLEERWIAVESDTKLPAQVKAQTLTEIGNKLAKVRSKIAAKPDHTTRTGRPEKPLIEKLEALLKDRPIQELEEAHKWLGNLIAERMNPKKARVPTANQKAAGMGDMNQIADAIRSTSKAPAKVEKEHAEASAKPAARKVKKARK